MCGFKDVIACQTIVSKALGKQAGRPCAGQASCSLASTLSACRQSLPFTWFWPRFSFVPFSCKHGDGCPCGASRQVSPTRTQAKRQGPALKKVNTIRNAPSARNPFEKIAQTPNLLPSAEWRAWGMEQRWRPNRYSSTRWQRRSSDRGS